jgi:hypothetical protein
VHYEMEIELIWVNKQAPTQLCQQDVWRCG